MKVFDRGQTPIKLSRFGGQDSGPLRAWDAADELIIDYLREQQLTPAKVLFVNDAFGALTLSRGDWLGETVIDSYCSHRAIQLNASANDLDPSGLHLLDSIQQMSREPKWVFIKIPKQLELLEHQLLQLSERVSATTKIVFGGMVKHTPKAIFDIAARWLCDVNVHRARRKARLIEGEKLRVPTGYTFKTPSYSIPELNLSIASHPQLFSAGKLDHASRLLMTFFQARNETNVLDLGCGAGVLGLAYARLHANASVSFTDESKMALTKAEINWRRNNFDPSRGFFQLDDCLETHPRQHYDLILCNPPFHHGHALDMSTARRMFNGAHQCLESAGRLIVVANRHLDHYRTLNRIFSSTKTLSEDPKFVVLESIKR